LRRCATKKPEHVQRDREPEEADEDPLRCVIHHPASSEKSVTMLVPLTGRTKTLGDMHGIRTKSDVVEDRTPKFSAIKPKMKSSKL
jgi:hypothetical protein